MNTYVLIIIISVFNGMGPSPSITSQIVEGMTKDSCHRAAIYLHTQDNITAVYCIEKEQSIKEK